MSAQQGERYRIVEPDVPEFPGRAPRINGQEVSIERYTSTFGHADGSTLVVVDEVGDVITASANVDYPRGANTSYRNVAWIDEHPDRFELIEAAPETEEEINN